MVINVRPLKPLRQQECVSLIYDQLSIVVLFCAFQLMNLDPSIILCAEAVFREDSLRYITGKLVRQ